MSSKKSRILIISVNDQVQLCQDPSRTSRLKPLFRDAEMAFQPRARDFDMTPGCPILNLTHGLASGDPYHNSVILGARAAPAGGPAVCSLAPDFCELMYPLSCTPNIDHSPYSHSQIWNPNIISSFGERQPRATKSTLLRQWR
ncbi:hypothetical protein NA56DRAFT_700929 [Hyaloscypha hepaticicola]|uniref:Uncharacterized protein n=1 Tax=Hyaloscypha hepaticicola TaxID=2082293 RepID=A0A2J6QBC9_9HELO|nr:hypothetical protein NA56DRAFT_700929 [Hyaloscypha hepaticicola]